MAFGFLSGHAVCQFIDRGLANVLCIETLSHGTSPLNYLKIRWQGGESKAKGFSNNLGSAATDTAGYFYLATEFSYPDAIPRMHSFLTGFNNTLWCLAPPFEPSEEDETVTRRRAVPGAPVLSIVGGLISAFITPTLNFRFRKEEITQARFEVDPHYKPAGSACRTTQKVEAWRIGFFGSIMVGLGSGWLNRVKQDPQRFIKGVVQLTGASLAMWYMGSTARTVSFLAGFMLG